MRKCRISIFSIKDGCHNKSDSLASYQTVDTDTYRAQQKIIIKKKTRDRPNDHFHARAIIRGDNTPAYEQQRVIGPGGGGQRSHHLGHDSNVASSIEKITRRHMKTQTEEEKRKIQTQIYKKIEKIEKKK